MKHFLASILLAAATQAWSATVYFGDEALNTVSPTDTGSPDGANSGAVTYVLQGNPLTNTSANPLTLFLDEVNFYSDQISGTQVTPFVATYDGGGIGTGTEYTIRAIGDAITPTAGINNASFLVGGATRPGIVLAPGETLLAGFSQDGRIVPYNGSGAAPSDYLSSGTGAIAGGVGSNLPNANWSTLNRNYSFNISAIVPEPSRALLLLAGGLGLLFVRRRK